jgi:hypothetical protein
MIERPQSPCAAMLLAPMLSGTSGRILPDCRPIRVEEHLDTPLLTADMKIRQGSIVSPAQLRQSCNALDLESPI